MNKQEEVAKALRDFITQVHTEWDSLHFFVTMSWDEDGLCIHDVAAVHPSLDPDTYPDLMTAFVRRSGRYADICMLEFEGYSVQIDAETTAEERNQIMEDLHNRNVHKRPDRVEYVLVVAVADDGEIWQARKERGHEDEIEEEHFLPSDDPRPTGRMIDGLLAAAITASHLPRREDNERGKQ